VLRPNVNIQETNVALFFHGDALERSSTINELANKSSSDLVVLAMIPDGEVVEASAAGADTELGDLGVTLPEELINPIINSIPLHPLYFFPFFIFIRSPP
jgi:hypothetical protein